jgi:hypothetical protein
MRTCCERRETSAQPDGACTHQRSERERRLNAWAMEIPNTVRDGS